MEQLKGKVAVVTGASAGIGATISIDLIKSGMIVVGLARRHDKILALKKQIPVELQNQLYGIKCDVRIESDIKAAFEWIRLHFNRLDVLINNAGILRLEYMLDKDNTNSLRDVVDTNIMGIALCTREAFHIMKENDDERAAGHIIMVNSIAGHKVPVQSATKMSTFNLYSPSKFALNSMTEILRQELEHFETKIRISVSNYDNY